MAAYFFLKIILITGHKSRTKAKNLGWSGEKSDSLDKLIRDSMITVKAWNNLNIL